MRLIILIFLFGSFKTGFAQSFQWAKKIGGTSIDITRAIAVDGSGNVIITGHFTGTADFDPGAATFSLTGTSGTQDAFVAKYDSSGNFIWAFSLTSASSFDKGRFVETDASGNIYIGGNFGGSIDMDPSGNNFFLTSSFYKSSFIARYDSNGNFQWAGNFYGNGADDTLTAFNVAANGNVYFAASLETGINFNSGETLTETSGAFFAAYNSTGLLIVLKPIVSSGSASINDIDNNSASEIFLCGRQAGIADFDPGTGVYPSVANITGWFGKYAPDGSFSWVKFFPAIPWSNTIQNISLEASTGNIFLQGTFSTGIDVDPSANTFNLFSSGGKIFFASYNPGGDFLWGKNFGKSNALVELERYYFEYVSGSGFLISGVFNDSLDFNPDINNDFYVNTNGSYDLFITKYSLQGDLQWVYSAGGAPPDAGYNFAVRNSDVYLCGYFRGTVDFDPSAATYSLTSSGVEDGVVIKLTDVSIGIDEEMPAAFLQVYPNPAAGQIYLNYDCSLVGKITLTISDIMGRKVEELEPEKIVPGYPISVGKLANGVYVYALKNDKKVLSSGRLVINNSK